MSGSLEVVRLGVWIIASLWTLADAWATSQISKRSEYSWPISCISRFRENRSQNVLWIGSWRCSCLVTWLYYQLIENKVTRQPDSRTSMTDPLLLYWLEALSLFHSISAYPSHRRDSYSLRDKRFRFVLYPTKPPPTSPSEVKPGWEWKWRKNFWYKRSIPWQ